MKVITTVLYSLFLLFSFGLNVSFAQGDSDFDRNNQRNVISSRNEILHLNQQIYLMAIKFKDFKTAKEALYSMLSVDSKNEILLFNLAYIYFDNEEFDSTVEVVKEVHFINPNNIQALELLATSYVHLNDARNAADVYENLYMKTQDINFLYRLVFMQYDLKNYEEAKVNTDILLQSPLAESTMYRFDQGKTEIEVPMAASVLNLKALIAVAQGQKKSAKQYFSRCLEKSPNFQQAIKGLKGLQKWLSFKL